MSEQETTTPPKPEADAGWYSNHTATFGDRVAAAREARGYSPAELARKLGVKQRTIESWEEDLTEPRANRLNIMAGILNVTLMWLLNGEGDGVSEPTEAVDGNADFKEILAEMRQIKAIVTQAGENLNRLEKRLRGILQETAV